MAITTNQKKRLAANLIGRPIIGIFLVLWVEGGPRWELGIAVYALMVWMATRLSTVDR